MAKRLTKLSEAMTLSCRASQNMKSSDKTWSTGEGNGNPLQYSYLEISMDGMKKKQKDMTSEDELSRLEDIQYVTGKEQRAITNSSSKNDKTGSKQE